MMVIRRSKKVMSVSTQIIYLIFQFKNSFNFSPLDLVAQQIFELWAQLPAGSKADTGFRKQFTTYLNSLGRRCDLWRETHTTSQYVMVGCMLKRKVGSGCSCKSKTLSCSDLRASIENIKDFLGGLQKCRRGR